jgi:hypothetical protein
VLVTQLKPVPLLLPTGLFATNVLYALFSRLRIHMKSIWMMKA